MGSCKLSGSGVKFWWQWALCLCLVLPLAGCRYEAKEPLQPGQKLKVLSTTGMIGDAVAAIGQDLIEAQVLMGPGVDPHLYKASQADIGKLSKAHVIFFNGLHLEGKMGDVLHKLSKHKTVVPVSEGIGPAQLRQVAEFGGTYDPHIWFDVKLWAQAVAIVGKTLAQADTAHAAIYKLRTEHYLKQLDSLDQWVKLQWQQVPVAERVLVTAHDAFGYYGDAYGVQVRGLQGISTQAEYGIQDVTQMVDYVVQNRIKAVFVESSVPAKALEAVVAGCKSRGWKLKLGPSLYSDALGDAGSPEGTYMGMVRYNTTVITQQLK